MNFRFKEKLSLFYSFCVSMAEPSSYKFAVVSHFASNPVTFFFVPSSWLSLSNMLLRLSPPIPLAWVVLPHSGPISYCVTSTSSPHIQLCSLSYTDSAGPRPRLDWLLLLILLPGQSIAEISILPMYSLWPRKKAWHPILQAASLMQNPRLIWD